MSIHANEEKWIPIEGYDGRYEVSNTGKVRSYSKNKLKPSILSQAIRRKSYNYRQVTLSDNNGRKKVFLLHGLVLAAFVGPRPKDMHGCHWDGDPGNNYLSNLRWGTPQENRDDLIRHGRHPRGESHGMVKLTIDQVREIRSASQGELRGLEVRLGVRRSTLTRIRNGTRWAGIK